LRNRSAVEPLGGNGGRLVTEAVCKASVLQQTFSHNFTTDNGIMPVLDKIRQPSSKVTHLRLYASLCAARHQNARAENNSNPDGVPILFLSTAVQQNATVR
jgi:hypothetical protein